MGISQKNRSDTKVSHTTIDYLKGLPLLRRKGPVLFAHNRPFVAELGLSSMVGNMVAQNVRRFFNTYPQAILFRGHSHSPELIWAPKDTLETIPLTTAAPIDLNLKIPCVITCGAVIHGHCQILEPDRRLACFSF